MAAEREVTLAAAIRSLTYAEMMHFCEAITSGLLSMGADYPEDEEMARALSGWVSAHDDN